MLGGSRAFRSVRSCPPGRLGMQLIGKLGQASNATAAGKPSGKLGHRGGPEARG